MDTRELLDKMLYTRGLTQKALCNRLKTSQQAFSRKVTNGTLRVPEILRIAALLDFDIQFIDRKTGKPANTRVEGFGRRVHQMVKGENYDTGQADAISNSFYADGEHPFTDGTAMELYIDRKGRFFFAVYSAFERANDRIVPVTAEEAADFLEKYGTKIVKGEPVYEKKTGSA